MIGDLTLTRRYDTPTGWLECDGRAVARADYPALLAAITFPLVVTLTAGSNVAACADPNLARVAGGFMVEGAGLANLMILAVDYGGYVQLNAPALVPGPVTLMVFPDGNGNGATTFNAPDLTGRAPLGAWQNRASVAFAHVSYYAPGQAGGQERVQLAGDNNGPHAHAVAFGATSGLAAGSNYNFGGSGAVVTGQSGLGTPHENRGPFYAVRVLIQAA